jgi:hypothetical protein
MSDEIEAAVSQVVLTKHEQRVDKLDCPRVLEKIGNLMAWVLYGEVFGYFGDARRKAFSMDGFRGMFRSAQAPRRPSPVSTKLKEPATSLRRSSSCWT